jgi:hypothetical protein
MLDIIKSERFKDEAIRKIYVLLQTPGIIPIAVHATLERSVKAINPSAESIKYTTEDLRVIWIKIRQILLETKVFDAEMIAELRSAMDEKIETVTQPNPVDRIGMRNQTPSYMIFEPDDTFVNATFDCILTTFISLMYIPSNWQGKATYLEFFKELAYMPNGFTYRLLTQIVRTFAGGTSNLLTFVNLLGNFVSVVNDPANTGIRKFSWVGVALSNQLALFAYGCLGTGFNTIFRILITSSTWNGVERFKKSLYAWFLVILWMFTGRYKGRNLLTFAEITERAGQCGTIDYQRWANFLINCFLEVDKLVGGGKDGDQVLDALKDEIGSNVVFQMVEWMNRPFDLQRIPAINQDAVDSNIPPETIAIESPKIGFEDVQFQQGDPQPMGRELSKYKKVEEIHEQTGGYYENVYQSARDLATLGSWGIFFTHDSTFYIYSNLSWVEETVVNFGSSRKDPTVGNFEEIDTQAGQVPRLVQLLRAIVSMFVDSLDYKGSEIGKPRFRAMLQDATPQDFRRKVVKEYALIYSGFLYNCILMLVEKGILQTKDTDGTLNFVRKTALTIATILKIFKEQYDDEMLFADTPQGQKVSFETIDTILHNF